MGHQYPIAVDAHATHDEVQAEEDVEPAGEVAPSGQGVQLDAPAPAYVLTGHVVHAVCEPEEIVPAAHCAHEVKYSELK